MYKLLRGGHNRWENGSLVKYRTGDTLELSEDEVKFLGDRVQLVSDGVDEGGENVIVDKEPVDTDNDFSFLSTLSWQDAVQAVSALDTLEDLEQARDYEKVNKGRGSVLAAIGRKIEALASLE